MSLHRRKLSRYGSYKDIRGLQYMAIHISGASWGNLRSLFLRNELRSPSDNSTLVSESFKWADGYINVVTASGLIKEVNPNVLNFLYGLSYDTYITPVLTGASLGDNYICKKSSFTNEDDIVLELHNYDSSATCCSSLGSTLCRNGFSSLNSTAPPLQEMCFGWSWPSGATREAEFHILRGVHHFFKHTFRVYPTGG